MNGLSGAPVDTVATLSPAQRRALAAATRLFASQGYDAVTLEQIAAEADVALGTIYATFGNKEGLLYASAEQRVRTPPLPTGETFDELVDHYLRELADGRSSRRRTSPAQDALVLRASSRLPRLRQRLAADLTARRAVVAGLLTEVRPRERLHVATSVIALLDAAPGFRAVWRGALPDAALRTCVSRLCGQNALAPGEETTPALTATAGPPPPPRTGRQRAQQRTRTSLLDATEKILVTHGLSRVSVARVAHTAGYSVGAVYSNFASKEELLAAVDARDGERRLAEIYPVDLRDPRRHLAAVLGSMVRFDQEYTALRIALGEVRVRYRYLARDHARRLGDQRVALSQLLAAAYGVASVPAPMPVIWLADAVVAVGYGLWGEWWLDPDVVDDALIASAFLRLLGSGVLPRTMAARQ